MNDYMRFYAGIFGAAAATWRHANDKLNTGSFEIGYKALSIPSSSFYFNFLVQCGQWVTMILNRSKEKNTKIDLELPDATIFVNHKFLNTYLWLLARPDLEINIPHQMGQNNHRRNLRRLRLALSALPWAFKLTSCMLGPDSPLGVQILALFPPAATRNGAVGCDSKHVTFRTYIKSLVNILATIYQSWK